MDSTRIDRRERMALQTRADILRTARRLFAERGYAATSVNDIAEEAGVALQTIYSRLGSKRGIVVALIDLIDEEAGVPEAAAAVTTASTPEEVLRAQNRLTRNLQERCGDIVGALIAAAALEPEVEQVVAEGLRRHRNGVRLTIDRISELGGLRHDLSPDHATALLSAATAHDAWYELVLAHKLPWGEAERTLNDALTRAILRPNSRKR
jgi:AcrR family transcriptional regulator